MRFITPFNYDSEAPTVMEPPIDPSLNKTEPCQAMSIRDMLKRHLAGQEVKELEGYYSELDDLDFDDYEPQRDGSYDLADYTRDMEDIRSRVSLPPDPEPPKHPDPEDLGHQPDERADDSQT